jgi:hypothetical protein
MVMAALGSGTFGMNVPGIDTPTKQPKDPVVQPQTLEDQEIEAYRQLGNLKQDEYKAKLYADTQRADAHNYTTETYVNSIKNDPNRTLLSSKIKERVDLKFIPTQETAEDIGLLFTLTNVLGFMIGGKSKGNAQQAMSAMNGMLEGHHKGREDLYKKEKTIFEVNSKALDKTIEALDKQFKEAMQLYAVDREAGMAKAESSIAEHNATFLGDSLKNKGLAFSADLLSKLVEQKNKRELTQQRIQDKAETKRHNLAVEAHQKQTENRQTQGTLIAVVVKDKFGKEKIAFYNNKTGAYVAADPRFGGATKLGGANASGTSATQRAFTDSMVTSANEITAMMKNVSSLPIIVNTGPFGGDKRVDGLSDLPIAYLSRKLNPEVSKEYNAITNGLGKAMANLMTQGRISSDSLMKVFDANKIAPDDPPKVILIKNANIRQEVERALDVIKTKLFLSDRSKELVEKINLEIKEAIPYTVIEAMKLQPEKLTKEEKTLTLKEYSEKYNIGYHPPKEESLEEINNVTGFPKENAKGWTLHSDNKGNYAYVGPNQEVEEIE